jgi:hypothetical protein
MKKLGCWGSMERVKVTRVVQIQWPGRQATSSKAPAGLRRGRSCCHPIRAQKNMRTSSPEPSQYSYAALVIYGLRIVVNQSGEVLILRPVDLYY